MKRPSKKEIKEALEKLREPKSAGGIEPETGAPRLEPKKANKNRIRKQGI